MDSVGGDGIKGGLAVVAGVVVLVDEGDLQEGCSGRVGRLREEGVIVADLAVVSAGGVSCQGTQQVGRLEALEGALEVLVDAVGGDCEVMLGLVNFGAEWAEVGDA